ncbi:Lariat debranching enzyme b [Globisporangium polare]
MVRVAVVGCAHGMLDDIFATVRFINEMDAANPVELLLCCGDFECMRNTKDLQNLACPPKYREMHSFHQYYKGEKAAPVLTIFIGGNHEASNYLSELHYGGWVAPNIFYLGAAGVVNVAGLRIGGLSGIYKQQDYTSGRFEKEPFDNSTMRSVYHVRELEVFQLSHLQMQDRKKVNVFLSHDWPRGVEQYGDVRTLIRRKPFFQQEIQANSLGSPAGEFLLFQLKPQHWFAAHLHVKFAALVRHAPAPPVPEAKEAKPASEGAASVDALAEQTEAIQPAEQEVTKFLALDKCLPRREFLQVVEIPVAPSTPTTITDTTDTTAAVEDRDGAAPVPEPTKQPLKVLYDFEWLAVLRATHHLASASRYAPRVPQEEMHVEASDIEWVRARHRELVAEKGFHDKVEGEWLSDFVKTAPAFGEEERAWDGRSFSGNPQTDLLLELLKLPHVVTSPYVGGAGDGAAGAGVVEDPNEIDLDDDLGEDADEGGDGSAAAAVVEDQEVVEVQAEDPNELDIDL